MILPLIQSKLPSRIYFGVVHFEKYFLLCLSYWHPFTRHFIANRDVHPWNYSSGEATPRYRTRCLWQQSVSGWPCSVPPLSRASGSVLRQRVEHRLLRIILTFNRKPPSLQRLAIFRLQFHLTGEQLLLWWLECMTTWLWRDVWKNEPGRGTYYMISPSSPPFCKVSLRIALNPTFTGLY